MKQEPQPYDSEQSTSLKNAAQRGDRLQSIYQIPEATLGRLKTAKKGQKRLAHRLARFGSIHPSTLFFLFSLACFRSERISPANYGQGFHF